MDASIDESGRQFEIEVEGKLALLAYYRKGDRIALVHTEVPRELGGRGIGGELVRSDLDHARGKKLRVFPFCSFVRAYIKRHPDCENLTEPLEEW